jgi:hypothetical protein
MYAVECASNTRVTCTTLGWRKRASLFQEAPQPPIERLLLPMRFGPYPQRVVAGSELVRIIFLDGDPGAEMYVLGGIGDAKATRADHAFDTVTLSENRILRQAQPAVQRDSP